MKGILTLIFLIILYNSSKLFAIDNDANISFEQIQSKYKLEIIYSDNPEVFPKKWRNAPINAKISQISEKETKRFPLLLKKALNKYPLKVIYKNLKKISLAKTLTFYGTKYGATNSLDVIYICSDGVSKGYTDEVIIKSFHHELSSILLRNYNFPKEKWVSYNPNGFQYKLGGLKAIKEGKASLIGSEELYKKGFLAEYSLSALEEDFNLYSEIIFSCPTQFKILMDKHKVIKQKFEVWLSFYQRIDNSFTKESLFKPETVP